jgi:hypothetical protein
MVNGPLPGIRHGRTAMPLTFGTVLRGHKALHHICREAAALCGVRSNFR